MSNNLPTVAIAGASGNLGQHIVTAFTAEPFTSRFREVILLSRKAGEDIPGTTNRVYSIIDVASSLQGVDVVVSCIGSKGNPVPFKEALIEAIAKIDTVKMYIASEFGVDHYINDESDTDFDFVEWRHKKELSAKAKRVFKEAGRDDIKTVHLFPGLLLELSVGAWFGMDCKEGQFEAIGNPDHKCSYTSMGDVGKAVAVLASMDPRSVPEKLRVRGDCVSMREIAKEMSKSSEREFVLSNVDAAEFEAKGLVQGDGKDPNGGLGNQNALVNPEEERWKWKTMREYARETNGRPWTT